MIIIVISYSSNSGLTVPDHEVIFTFTKIITAKEIFH